MGLIPIIIDPDSDFSRYYGRYLKYIEIGVVVFIAIIGIFGKFFPQLTRDFLLFVVILDLIVSSIVSIKLGKYLDKRGFWPFIKNQQDC